MRVLPDNSLTKYGKEYGQDNADNDARGEGKVEAELFSFDINVPRQASDIGDLVGKHEPKPDNNEQQTKGDKRPA
jgi:hypothetical protein